MNHRGFCYSVIFGWICCLITNGYTFQKSDNKNFKPQAFSTYSRTNSSVGSIKHLTDVKFSLQNEDTLHYDGPNNDGIGLTTGGTFMGAVRFTPELSCSLKSVIFFHRGYTSHSGNIRIYGPGTNISPGHQITSTAYTAPDSNWYRVDFSPPVFLSGSIDFWTAVEITHVAGEYPLGCDAGPMVQDRGGFVTQDGGTTWEQLNEVGLDYNWNIRAIVHFVILDHDVGVSKILAPVGAVPQGSVITPSVIIRNFGTNSETFPVVMKIGNIYCETLPSVSLNIGQIDTVEFPDWTAIPGSYHTTAYTDLVGDMNLRNDTAYGLVAVVEYIEDFEANDGNFEPDPLTNAWQWGIPTSGPYGAHSEVNVWGTILAGQYIDYANWQLNSCEFQATADNSELHFWHWYDMEGYYDGGNVKISTNGGVSWTIIQPQGGYPESEAAPGNVGIPGEPCYSGTSIGWEEAVFPLPIDSGQIFQLRWHFGTDVSVTYDGWYIDDIAGAGFNIVTIDHDVSATKILEPAGSVQQGSVVIPKVIIRNFGINNENFSVVMMIGTTYCETLPSVSLNAGQIDTVEFPGWTAVIGLFTTTAFTDLSGDMRRSNDTTRGSVTVLEFVQNFESNNGGYLSDPSSSAWEWGTPTSGPGNVHSGVNLWATVLGGEYTDYANWKLSSTGFQATQNNPELRFWHWYDIESGWDGGNVKLSTNGGNTWMLIEPQGDYPDTASEQNAGIPNEPCYSGHPMIWQEAVFTMPVNSGQMFKLRWHFGTDGSATYDGWYIDDVAGAGFHVGIADEQKVCEIIQPFLLVGSNPIAHYQAKIQFGVKQTDNISLTIFDASGRLVRTLVQRKMESGKYDINWNTNDNTGSRVSNGIYLMVYQSTDTKLTKKIIINQ